MTGPANGSSWTAPASWAGVIRCVDRHPVVCGLAHWVSGGTASSIPVRCEPLKGVDVRVWPFEVEANPRRALLSPVVQQDAGGYVV